MTEEYLHYVWDKKKFPILNLKLSTGSELKIIDSGKYNRDRSGPDFWFAKIQIDGIVLCGHIEIHIKSSDWYKHNHHLDSNYNNVILHVVYRNDKEVIQNGTSIPTLELSSVLEKNGFQMYLKHKLFEREFLCENMMESISPVYLEFMKGQALQRKLMLKMSILTEISRREDDSEVLYYLIGQAFGMGINQEGFSKILTGLPYHQIAGLKHNQRFKLIMSESGLYNDIVDDRSKSAFWHFKGTRPANFPSLRIHQFIQFVDHFDFNTTFIFKQSPDEIIFYFKDIINRIWQQEKYKVGKVFQNNLLINGVVPFVWLMGERRNDDLLRDKALDMLALLPAENNVVIRKWKALKIPVQNAYDSQSLLALYRYYCCHKKCLSCSVGHKILNRSDDSKNNFLF